jgi:hypothetical protein
MLDYGVFYEFIEINDYMAGNYTRKPLWEVETGREYAMVISTNAGLWAYDIGDTVRFTSTKPYRLKVVGRVKHFISAFGEHVIIEEINRAMVSATEKGGVQIIDFTVAPLIRESGSCHEWFIEFQQPPAEPEQFARLLDQSLQESNSYYRDLRSGNVLNLPQITQIETGGIRNYMQSVGKLGGQNKFPRATNNRDLADALQPYLKK